MAKLEAQLHGNFDEVLDEISSAILNRSATASLEEKSDFAGLNARCAVRVYERYSYTGQNRVSMNVTLFETEGRLFVSAVTSGGSQAMLFKINTFGEEAFLDLVKDVIDKYRA
ncbi:MAG: DUF6054 family protein [Acutalibacteraceae bacterium]|nr:DUF6054 family protein [Acutalibacteraceae bacterium]